MAIIRPTKILPYLTTQIVYDSSTYSKLRHIHYNPKLPWYGGFGLADNFDNSASWIAKFLHDYTTISCINNNPHHIRIECTGFPSAPLNAGTEGQPYHVSSQSYSYAEGYKNRLTLPATGKNHIIITTFLFRNQNIVASQGTALRAFIETFGFTEGMNDNNLIKYDYPWIAVCEVGIIFPNGDNGAVVRKYASNGTYQNAWPHVPGLVTNFMAGSSDTLAFKKAGNMIETLDGNHIPAWDGIFLYSDNPNHTYNGAFVSVGDVIEFRNFQNYVLTNYTAFTSEDQELASNSDLAQTIDDYSRYVFAISKQ